MIFVALNQPREGVREYFFFFAQKQKCAHQFWQKGVTVLAFAPQKRGHAGLVSLDPWVKHAGPGAPWANNGSRVLGDQQEKATM